MSSIRELFSNIFGTGTASRKTEEPAPQGVEFTRPSPVVIDPIPVPAPIVVDPFHKIEVD